MRRTAVVVMGVLSVSAPTVRADLTGLALPPMELAVSVSETGERTWRLIVGWKEAKLRRSFPDVDAFITHNVARELAERKECPAGWQIDRRESMPYAVIVHGRCR